MERLFKQSTNGLYSTGMEEIKINTKFEFYTTKLAFVAFSNGSLFTNEHDYLQTYFLHETTYYYLRIFVFSVSSNENH